MEYKKSSSGQQVKKIQLKLNLLLQPSPKLALDGVFGPKTEAAVILFQQQQQLKPDGIVGPKTYRSLMAPPAPPAPPQLSKFIRRLGVIDDFVAHVAEIEATAGSTGELMDRLLNFSQTLSGKRYLLVQGDTVGVIDFRHFFAAAAESYNSGMSRQRGLRLGGNPGNTMMLGVANELGQCLDEGLASQLNSCFSIEDLGTNRLGALFGELIRIREAEASQRTVSQYLRAYLIGLLPVSSQQVAAIQTQGRWDIAVEILLATKAWLGDLLVSPAY